MNPMRRDVEINLDFKYGSTKLFFEFTFDIGNERRQEEGWGKIRINHLDVYYGYCTKNVGYVCTDPAQVDSIIMK